MTLLILTDAESRLIRLTLTSTTEPGSEARRHAAAAFHAGIQRGTDKMTEESEAEWKARKL